MNITREIAKQLLDCVTHWRLKMLLPQLLLQMQTPVQTCLPVQPAMEQFSTQRLDCARSNNMAATLVVEPCSLLATMDIHRPVRAERNRIVLQLVAAAA